MGRDKHEKARRHRLPPFVPLLVETLDQPAWRAMSHGAKMLYIALKRRITPANNGKVFLSQRNAAEELQSHHNQIARWYRELQHYGFIVMSQPGFLGLEGKGQAPRWRLTEIAHMGEPPTRDFARWDGTLFEDRKNRIPCRKSGTPRAGKAAQPRAGNPARSAPEPCWNSSTKEQG